MYLSDKVVPDLSFDEDMSDCPELQRNLFTRDLELLQKTSCHQSGNAAEIRFFKAIDSLQRFGHWQVSQRFASTLLALLTDLYEGS
jgi:hypothetical protein